MTVVIDTSTLIQLVRYYLPFDSMGVLREFVRSKIIEGEIIVLDKVADECRYVLKGAIIQEFEFIEDKKYVYNCSALIPLSPSSFFRSFDNSFTNKYVISAKGLSESELEAKKQSYQTKADYWLIIYARNETKKCEGQMFGADFRILTEETSIANYATHGGEFKKIPDIAKIYGVKTVTLSEYLKSYKNEINIIIEKASENRASKDNL